MAQTICQKHMLPIENICALDKCQNAFCSECIIDHSNNTQHHISVKLTQRSKEFFITWNQYMIPRIGQMIGRLKMKGFNAVFQMTNKNNNVSASINQLQSSQINQIALQVLSQQKNIIIQNINFVSSTKNLDDLRVPDFYKDLYSLFLNDLASNMRKITQTIEKRLMQKLPTKKIYKQIQFKFNQRDMKLLQDTKVKLIRVIQKKVITNLNANNQPSLNKSGSQMQIKNIIINSPRKYIALEKLQVKDQEEKVVKINPESPVYKKPLISPKSQIYSPKSSNTNLNFNSNSYSGKQLPKNTKDFSQNQTAQSPKSKGFDFNDSIKKNFQRRSFNAKSSQTNQQQTNQNINSKSTLSSKFSRTSQNNQIKNKFLSPNARLTQSPKQQQIINSSDKNFINENQVRNLKRQVNKIKIELQDKNNTIKKNLLQKDQYEKNIFALQKQINSLQNQVAQINFSNETNQSKLERQLKDVKFDTQKQRRQFESKIRSLENSLHNKQNEIEKLKRNNQTMKENLNHKSQFIKDMLNQFSIKVTIRDNQEQLLKKQIQILLASQQQLQSKISQQSQILSEFKIIKRVDSTQQLQKTAKIAHSRNNSSQGQYSQSKIDELINEKDDLIKRLLQKDQIFELYKTQKEHHIKQLQEQIKQYVQKQDFKFSENMKNQKNLNSNKSQHIETLKQTIKDLQSKLIESRQSQQQHNLTEENQLLRFQIKQYRAKIKELQNQVSDEANIDDQLLQQMVELDTQIAVRNKDIEILAKTVMQCAKKYSVDSEFLKKKFKGLTTIKFQTN